MVSQPRTESHMHLLWANCLTPLMKWFIADDDADALIPIQNLTDWAPCMPWLLPLGNVDPLSTRHAESHESQTSNFLHEKKPVVLKQCLVAWCFMEVGCATMFQILRQVSMASLTHFSGRKIQLASLRRLVLLVQGSPMRWLKCILSHSRSIK